MNGLSEKDIKRLVLPKLDSLKRAIGLETKHRALGLCEDLRTLLECPPERKEEQPKKGR